MGHERKLYILYGIYGTGKQIIGASTQQAVVNALFETVDYHRPLELSELTYSPTTGEATERSIKYTDGSGTVFFYEGV